MRVHPRTPDRGRANEAPLNAAAIILAPDLFSAHLAGTVECRRLEISVACRLVPDAANETGGRTDGTTDACTLADGRDEVPHAFDIGSIIPQVSVFLEIRP